MRQVDLTEYQTSGLLGAGADYEVRLANDRRTSQSVVLKRPLPQTISRRMHLSAENRSDQTISFYKHIGNSIPQLSPMIGYSEKTDHSSYYDDTLEEEYTVLVFQRAKGIPLVGDARSRILKVPIGIGQNLFALYPLPYLDEREAFYIQQQLMEMQSICHSNGYLLLDLNPQNVFFDPLDKTVTVIDTGDLIVLDQPQSTRQPRDIRFFYLEMLKYYSSSIHPPNEISEYREPHGMRPILSIEDELYAISQYTSASSSVAAQKYSQIIERIRTIEYLNVDDFRVDLTAFFDKVRIQNREDIGLADKLTIWHEAALLLSDPHWAKYDFAPEEAIATIPKIET
ncbi:MAG: hypothetical protein CL886_03465 [Dehalococcoidia bacterium]|nr:hypothetical protein [Dehalococcoidia bacterium]